MSFLTTNLYFAAAYKVFFITFGTIGNLLFIHLNFRRKQLRSRTSVLQCFQCAFHIFCLFGSIFEGALNFMNPMNRYKCFWFISYFIFSQTAQDIIMLIIVLDILCFVQFPFLYMRISKIKYIFFTGFPVFITSCAITVYSYYVANYEYIPDCAPMFVLDTFSSIIHKILTLFLNGIVTFVYIILICIFYLKNQTGNQNSLKTMKRLQFSVAIFIFTWFFSQAIALFLRERDFQTTWEIILYVHNSFLTLLSFSNTFYVAIWQSDEYRNNFRLEWGFKRRVSTTNPNTFM
ncbi:G-protein coupled receptors family 1 profile domain-containing protein [Caenorhabditis elegans]|uniref:G-protein coupled receptors family 1 profile domain-containing protein n=1 Tax=Caenorhabditis elegans TaxID=6239 RepID=Q5CCI6_CAEEL|nr:G-protein coupled receptors family 1 profile domain-containing protein [Caenorhabditis elegans]CCD62603.1 G-protein coupled receptors family 1 profile domain-containing protein [Caenorhabditis elegans]|eukprot:NP_001023863.1 Serpentine Receptor, class SX [Caenorhabditis elegans]